MNRRPPRPRCAAAGLHQSPAAASDAPWHCAPLLRRTLLTLRVLAGFGGILLSSHCASDAAGRGSANRDPLVALSRVEITRAIEPRLSIPTTYRPCSAAIPTGGTVPRAGCKTATGDRAPSSAVLDVAQRASARIRASADPDALHAAALIDLIWGGEGKIPLERAVSYLRTASRLAPREAGVFADLAAALLVRAERHQTPRDLVEAVEMTDVALELEPRNQVARFNLALGLDRLGLDGQAQRAWTAFLQLDSTSHWAEEARHRARPPAEAANPPPAPRVDARESEIAAYVRAGPEAAMLFGWDHALDNWATGVVGGDAKGAENFLSLAGAIGDELERQGRDATLGEAVHAITTSTRRPSAIATLARAHHEYAVGRAAYRANDVVSAGRSFKHVLTTPGISMPLAGWARFYYGAALIYQGHLDGAESELRQLAAHADTMREPSLAGRAHWALGTTLLRRGRYQQAIQALEAAAAFLGRAGERENVGSVESVAADAKQVFAGASAEYEARQRALITLRPYQRSVGLHNVFYSAAITASGDGFPRTAVRLQDEGVEVADRISDEIHPAEARIARARFLLGVGRRSEAVKDLDSARVLVDALKPGPTRNWFRADLQATEAATLAGLPAIQVLDSAAAFWRAQNNQLRLMPVLVARSDAALTAGDIETGTADLDRALALVDEQSSHMTSAELRASLLDATQRVVDRLVMLRVGSSAPKKALADLERARVSLAPVRARLTATSGWRLVGTPGQVAAEYALIGDTLLIWTVADTAVRLTRATVDRTRLVQTIERTRAALELRSDEAAVERDLAALYDWLLRPVEGHLGTPGTPVVLIADGEIAGVPFAALHDTAQRQYLIEQHPLRFVSSLRDAARKPLRMVANPKVLLVADPAFDQAAFPGLSRLPGAAAETEAVAGAYADTVLLAGSAATRMALDAALERANILHYAGHAVFDDERPEQSLLVLAPESGEVNSGRETADGIAGLDLARVRLVVLSACETNRSRNGRSGGFAGLAGAFLAAGAGGVLGSLWRVDDKLTRTLMTEFHGAYRARSDAAGALREAQLRLLRYSDPTISSPAAWAGFRYAGN